ncbi:MAG: translation initiation factor IF-2 [Desulfarculus sp.]|nr:translation initiation factor IF-2 [Desulfarculus sp.]
MAKLRVYELAKELKVDNKDLLRQLIELGLDVRNHMSVISPEEAQVVRERLRAERSDVVEEKRVTTRVIRRRRKTVEEEGLAAEEEPALEAAPAPEEAPAPEPVTAPAAPKPAPAPAAVAEAPPALEPAPAPAAVAAAEPQAAEAAPAAVEAQAPPEPAPPAVAPEPAPAQAQAPPAPPVAPQAPAPEPAPIPEAPSSSAAEEKAVAEPQPQPAVEPQPLAAEEPIQPPRAAVKPKEQPRPKPVAREEAPKPRRPAGDTPARIISRPTQPVAPVVEQRFAEGRPARPPMGARPPLGPRPPRPGMPAQPAVGDVPPPEKLDERNRPRRKKGKKTTSAIPDDEFLMRKAASKKKEILDKADLYDRPAKGKRGRGAAKRPKKTELTTPKAIKRRVRVGEAITVGELAKRMGVKSAELVGRLMQSGMMVTLNQSLDVEDAALVATEFGFEVERVAFEEEGLLEQAVDREEDLHTRPPVVTIMGHVDHGKTSLLDTIRRSNVVSGEAGGITQHIGAYNVRVPSGGQVVFVDTPGHEAFTQMRARGAQVTDVVVLVVSADDGVMQQTKEAIAHSRAANVPIVVAINKIDKPGADPERVRRELADQGLVSEAWGGDVIMVEVSAKTGQGVDSLLDMLNLQSEILELKANPQKPARGHILEARLDKGRGPVASVLVQDGTLKTGDPFVCGVHAGKVRALFDDLGQRVDEAGPSIPVEVQGFAGVPEAGDEFAVVESDKVAKQIAEHRALKKREAELSSQTRLTLEGFFEQMKEGAVQELKLIVKGDVQGSVQALVDALNKLGNEQVKVNVIQAATGAITETDVMLASASNAIIIGFNVRPTGKVGEIAEAEHVDVRTYDIIYQVLDDVTAALTGMLAPVMHEEVLGRAEVRETFSVPKIGVIAGCSVTSGKVERNAQARLLREGVVVATTKISSLRRFKEDVKEVVQGYECGIGLDNYNDIKVGDEIEAFVTREVAAEL